MGGRVNVSFPKLGLDFDISREAFRIFNTPIYWYGILIALAFLVCVLWAMKDSKKFDYEPETVIDLMLFAAPAAIIGARLYYVIFSWENYKYEPMKIFDMREGGLAVIGGVLFAIIAAYFVVRYKKIPILKYFDFAVVYIPLGQAIGRLGNFFNQEAFGTNTELPWGMTSPVVRNFLQNLSNNGVAVNPEQPVHPTFLYELLWNLVIFAFLMWMRRHKKFNGEVFCFYFIGYGIGRAVIEGLRTDSLMIGSLRVSQLLSVIFIIVFSIIVLYTRSKLKNNFDSVEVGQSGYAGILKILEEEQKVEEQSSSDQASAQTEVQGETEAGAQAEAHTEAHSEAHQPEEATGTEGSTVNEDTEATGSEKNEDSK